MARWSGPRTHPSNLMSSSERTVVLGLGNPVLRDDGVGLAVVSALRGMLAVAPIPGVDVLASTRAGFELIDLLHGYASAVIVDCLTLPDPEPGRVRCLDIDAVGGSARLVNAHEISIGTAFRLAEQMGIPMPRTVRIVGIEAADTSTIAEGLTPEVAAVVAPVARQIHADLKRCAPSTEPPDSPEFQHRRAFYSPETD